MQGGRGIDQWRHAERIFPTLGSPAAVSDDLKYKNEIYSYFVYFCLWPVLGFRKKMKK